MCVCCQNENVKTYFCLSNVSILTYIYIYIYIHIHIYAIYVYIYIWWMIYMVIWWISILDMYIYQVQNYIIWRIFIIICFGTWSSLKFWNENRLMKSFETVDATNQRMKTESPKIVSSRENFRFFNRLWRGLVKENRIWHWVIWL